MLAGQIRVPRFQRGIKWELQDALDLLDSIYRGYPVGTLLLWQRPAEAEHIVHGSVLIEALARRDALMVVDGQQRILSLTRVLAGGGFPEEPFAAFFDLQQLRFFRPKRREQPQPHHLPLTEVLDSERLVRWMVENRDPAVDQQAAIRLGKRLREYQIPAYVVTSDDERSVREIFRRANNTGKRMDDSDVFNAIHGRNSPEPGDLRDVAAVLRALDFGTIDEPTLLRMLSAIHGTDPTKEKVPEFAPDAVQSELLGLVHSAQATIAFLRSDAGIPHISLLPYQQPLLALARFFHRHPEPHPRSRELLARWLWRGALTGAHDGNAVKTRQMLAAIGDDEHEAIQVLLRMLPPRPAQTMELEEFSFAYARCKIQLLALLELRPRDLRTGELISAGSTSAELSHEDAEEFDGVHDLKAAIPENDAAYKRLLRVVCRRPPELQSSLANRLIHPSVHSGILRTIVNCDEPDWLDSHGITPQARRALKFDNIAGFLKLRRESLQVIVQQFAEHKAEWDEIDSQPIEALQVLSG